VSIATFVRESRFRRALAQTHELVSDMLLRALEDNITTAAAAAEGIGGGATGASSSSALTAASASARPSLKSIQRRKHAYLSALLSSRIRPREILSSLHDEVTRLRAPLEESLERVAHWKRTSEAFFARSIELTAQKNEMERALTQTSSKIDHAKLLMRRERGEQEEMAQRNVELMRANAALRTELDRVLAGGAHSTTGSAAVSPKGAGIVALSVSGSPPLVALPLASVSAAAIAASATPFVRDAADEKQPSSDLLVPAAAAASDSHAIMITPRRGVNGGHVVGYDSPANDAAFVISKQHVSPAQQTGATPVRTLPSHAAAAAPIYYSPQQPPLSPQPPPFSPQPATASAQLQRQIADLQRERYNAAVASGAAHTPRKVAALAAASAASSSCGGGGGVESSPRRRPEASGFNLPHVASQAPRQQPPLTNRSTATRGQR